MTITVRVYAKQEDVRAYGCELEYSHFDTLKEAKEKAKYYLTEDYRRSSEASDRLGYSQVLKDGKCIYDYFAK